MSRQGTARLPAHNTSSSPMAQSTPPLGCWNAWVNAALLPALLPTASHRGHPCVTIQLKISKGLKPENVNWSFYLRRSQLTVTMKQRKRSWVIYNKLYQLPHLSGTADFLILLAVLCGSSKMTLLFDWIYP